MFPVPDQLTVFVNFLDAMQGNVVSKTILIGDLASKMIAGDNVHPLQRHLNDLSFHAVMIADHEIPLRECAIPAKPVEQFMNGAHRDSIYIESDPIFRPFS